jgi:hypothetical protein
MKIIAIANSGERTRLACRRWRPRRRELFLLCEIDIEKKIAARAPQSAREGAYAPQASA